MKDAASLTTQKSFTTTAASAGTNSFYSSGHLTSIIPKLFLSWPSETLPSGVAASVQFSDVRIPQFETVTGLFSCMLFP